MSEIKVNKITPRTGTTITLGDSGDSLSIASGVALTDFTSTGIDDNATSTALTIDSSGNVLVSTTNSVAGAGNTDVGVVARADGGLFASRGGSASLFNRNTSDGDIVQFRKDGTTVGSIGVDSSDNFYIGATTASHAGLYMWSNGVTPMIAGSQIDDTVNLGRDIYRYKNLYLGGNIYLGGTGSANALDDYEEGTTSVYLTVEGGGTVSGTFTSSYTKIGNRVFVRFRADITGITGASSSKAMEIRGLPFTVTSTADSTGCARIGNLGSSVTGHQVLLFSNGTNGRIEEWNGTTSTNLSDHFQNGSSVILELSYETTA